MGRSGTVLLVLALLACKRSPPPEQQQTAPAAPTVVVGPTAAPSAAKPGEDAPTCAGVCARYHRCVKITAQDTIDECTRACEASKPNAAVLRLNSKRSCGALIAAAKQPAGGGQKPAARSSECQGCVKDGNDCVWISQGNWGQGPYSGAVSSCDPKCCGGGGSPAPGGAQPDDDDEPSGPGDDDEGS